MNIVERFTISGFICLFGFSACTTAPEQLSIIPQPAEMQLGKGSFTFGPQTGIVIKESFREVGLLIRDQLASDLGFQLKLLTAGTETRSNSVVLELTPPAEDLESEQYELEVKPDLVTIRAPNNSGLLHGIQTLRQMLPIRPVDGGWVLPCALISDHPRFSWRGLMLDCSRTFQSMDYLKKTIDRLSFYKMNILHLHLTDDQGWRVELQGFPELTGKGARFPEKYGQPAAMQGYYTQPQIRELVKYAKNRNITIVPEIEMPGHSLAALSCYPDLSCTGNAFEIYPFFEGPNITEDIYCAGNEQTFLFLEAVIDEIVELFPSKYIHVGGDEAPKTRWKKCPKCQTRIEEEGLQDENQLQSYFIERIEKYINSKGRQLIGWDEILQGGLAPNAAVMSWRSVDGGIEAARSKHFVVMSPTSHCYFDYTYEKISTRKAFSFDPLPPQIGTAEASYILGLQANFWSHIDRTPERVDHQLFPRLLAIAERGWSPRERNDWDDFSRRLESHWARLDMLQITYRDRSNER